MSNTAAVMKSFWKDGFVILHDKIENELIEEVLSISKKVKFSPVFGSLVEKTMDDKRFQGLLPTKNSKIKRLTDRIKSILVTLDKNWKPEMWNVLHSLAGGNFQDPHRDYPTFEISDASIQSKNQSIQGSLIVALMNDTHLRVYKGCFAEAWEDKIEDLRMSCGDVLVFRGDLVHCGSSYDKENFRLHCYLEVAGVKRIKGVTEYAATHLFHCGIVLQCILSGKTIAIMSVDAS